MDPNNSDLASNGMRPPVALPPIRELLGMTSQQPQARSAPSTDHKPAATQPFGTTSSSPIGKDFGFFEFPRSSIPQARGRRLDGAQRGRQSARRAAQKIQQRASPRTNRSTPYRTDQEYKNCIKECLLYGKLQKIISEQDSSETETNFEYYQHPFNNSLYSCKNKNTEALTLWTQNKKSLIWKQNLYRGMYHPYGAAMYKSVLDGGQQQYRGTNPRHPAESTPEGFITVMNNRFNMSDEQGRWVREEFWESDTRKNLYAAWEMQQQAEKERKERAKLEEKLQEQRVKREEKQKEKAEKRRAKQAEKDSNKRRKTETQPNHFASPVNNIYRGGMQFVFNGPVSTDAVAALASSPAALPSSPATLPSDK